MRSFRGDAQAGGGVWSDVTTVDGVVYTSSLAPGPARNEVAKRILKSNERRAAILDPAIDELREIVSMHEPIELICSVAVPTSVSFDPRGNRPDDATETVTWPARIEYLLGVALSVAPGTGSTPTDVTQRVMDLLDDVFDAARATNFLDSIETSSLLDNEALDAVANDLTNAW